MRPAAGNIVWYVHGAKTAHRDIVVGEQWLGLLRTAISSAIQFAAPPTKD